MTIGVVMGGYSSEYDISIGSGEVVLNALKEADVKAYKVLILPEKWSVIYEDVEYLVDKNDFSFIARGNKVKFDVVFNAIHGTPGEDGKIQAYFELVGQKHTSSGFFESALTFNKAKTNMVLSHLGIDCPKGLYFSGDQEIDHSKLIQEIGFPMFIKPSRAGSSYGISRIEKESEIAQAIAEAKKEDSDIVVESEVAGVEVGCGLARVNGKIKVLAITEIVSKNAFFDFQAKYEGASDEITPARISDELTNRIGEISTLIYEQLDLRGVVRVDFIIEAKSNKPIFIEVNTVPGLSEESIVPKQLTYMGYKMSNFFLDLINEALNE